MPLLLRYGSKVATRAGGPQGVGLAFARALTDWTWWHQRARLAASATVKRAMTYPQPSLPPLPQGVTIQSEPPSATGLDLLFLRHHQAMHADTPPESIHMMPRDALASRDIAFFVLRQGNEPLAMGALSDLGGGLAEIKSMHVLAEARGRGLSRLLLRHMIAIARQRGFSRLSLETGAQPSFAPARKLYASEGFVECPPFADYRPDPNSTFMTLALD